MLVNGSAKHRGFTLIEVMVALSIFGVAALAALNAASSHLTSISDIQNKTMAQYVASNRLVDLSLQQQWPLEDDASGTAEFAEQQWQWRQQIKETVTPNVVAVTVIVSKPNSDYQLARFTRYIRKPETAGAKEPLT